MTHTIPDEINGTLVEPSGQPMTLRGETWVTMVPIDDDDMRLWEFSVTTGRIVETSS